MYRCIWGWMDARFFMLHQNTIPTKDALGLVDCYANVFFMCIIDVCLVMYMCICTCVWVWSM